MKFKAVCLGHSRFVVNRSEKMIKMGLRKVIPKVLIFFLFLHENVCFGYSLEAPPWGASNEYSQHTFSCFHGNIREILSGYPSYWSGAMNKYLEEGWIKSEYIFYKSITRVLQKVLSLCSDYFSATFYQTYFYYKPTKYSPFTETHFLNLFTESRKADKYM